MSMSSWQQIRMRIKGATSCRAQNDTPVKTGGGVVLIRDYVMSFYNYY